MDWGLGIPLKKGLLGKNTSLEVHHIFPRNFLKKNNFAKSETNAIANFCFLTKDTNIKISDKNPETYFQEIEDKFPGALASQWIPMDKELWKVSNYLDFLEARKCLLADAANSLLDSLYVVEKRAERSNTPEHIVAEVPQVGGGISDDEEAAVIDSLNEWIRSNDLPPGEVEYELVGKQTGNAEAILDLAWPGGVQSGYSEPVAVLLDETADVVQAASQNGYRVFTSVEDFKSYVKNQILGDPYYGLPEWALDVEESAIPIVRHLVAAKLAKPICGFEIQDAQNEIIGEFELAWPDRRVGVWTTRGNEKSNEMHKLGWLAYDQQEITENYSILNNALGA
jgi:hypothetical protein